MKNAWIVFSKDSDLAKVEEGLKKVTKVEGIDKFHLCFIPRKLVEKLNWDLSIVELLEKYLGDRAIWDLERINTLEEYLEELPKERLRVARLVKKLYVLDSRNAGGVRAEIEAYTNFEIEML